MAEEIKSGDFVQLEYSGSLAEDGSVFDTTDAAVAEEHGIHNAKAKYGPITICVGEHQLIKGIDAALIGKAAGGEYVITVPPEDAFGKKDAKRIQLVPTQKFLKEGIRPMPGLQINVDGTLGTVKSVSGGRTLVDFNHPLAGREVRYEVKVLRKVTDTAEKLGAFIGRTLQVEPTDVEVTGGKATVTLPFELPEEMRGEYIGMVRKAVPEITGVEFRKPGEREAEEGKAAEENAERQGGAAGEKAGQQRAAHGKKRT